MNILTFILKNSYESNYFNARKKIAYLKRDFHFKKSGNCNEISVKAGWKQMHFFSFSRYTRKITFECTVPFFIFFLKVTPCFTMFYHDAKLWLAYITDEIFSIYTKQQMFLFVWSYLRSMLLWRIKWSD